MEQDGKEGVRVAPQARLAVALGLAIGDSLGATSEFQIPSEVGRNCVDVYPGWPGKLVGGGKARWRCGVPTDDTEMALAILRAVANEKGAFSPLEITRHFLAWLDTNPKDVGGTTRRTLLVCRRTQQQGDKQGGMTNTKDKNPTKTKTKIDPFAGGMWDYERNPENAANGSLMRNGVVAALYAGYGNYDAEHTLVDFTVLHGVITHWAPLPVLTCVLQSLLIQDALMKRARGETPEPPTFETLEELISGPWTTWKKHTSHPDTQSWLKSVGAFAIGKAERQLLTELRGFERFQPYTHDYRNNSGYCVLTLKIALWALHWSFQSTHPELPAWLPEWPYLVHGFDTLMWVVLIGADADTYGATAGPLLAAYHPEIKEQFKEGLQVRPLIRTYVEQVEQRLRPRAGIFSV